jgi:hypothetical protein
VMMPVKHPLERSIRLYNERRTRTRTLLRSAIQPLCGALSCSAS